MKLARFAILIAIVFFTAVSGTTAGFVCHVFQRCQTCSARPLRLPLRRRRV